ncbi:MAG: hypothetical protein PHS41_02085 [Victivallaceae bacterium]|nr:hypothetical protein [Victivallaceae bacterium]
MTESKKCCAPHDALDADALQTVAEELEATFQDGVAAGRMAGLLLPSSREVMELADMLFDVIFPGYLASAEQEHGKAKEALTARLKELNHSLYGILLRACRVGHEAKECGECKIVEISLRAAGILIGELPAIREAMKLSVKAAYAGDPAAKSFDEIVLSYPCIRAILVQRCAHVLYREGIPFIPRMLTEYVHSLTGIDIHPGAELGEGVFIDHGTGVVIGETARLGNNVRIYQGVTLGALSFPKNACGMLIKGQKRHPTIEDDVVIYAGATILGDITIGARSVVGGNVWLTESLPAGTKITARMPENVFRYASEVR